MLISKLFLGTIILFTALKCGSSLPEPVDSQNTEGFLFLALGDSYTIGEGVEPKDNWPMQLSVGLRERGVELQTPQIIAATGWTTSNLGIAIDQENPQGVFDLVSLSIGVNNQYQGIPIRSFRGDFVGLLNRAIQFAGGDPSKVFVVSIPDYGVTPFGRRGNANRISQEIDDYNAIIKAVCTETGILYIDVNPISKMALNDASLLASDGLHPSGKMYAMWVDLMEDQVSEILKK